VEPRSGGVRFDEVDITDEEKVVATIHRTAAQFGGIDVLVNSHAHFIHKPNEEAASEDWDKIMAVNIKGTAFTCKHATPHMRARGGGSIVNLGAKCGARALNAFTPYSTTKAAMLHFTTSIARELADDNIRANVVCPGSIGPTDLLSPHMMPRMGTEREVADAVLWLASDESSFTTAQTLFVDGGSHGTE